MTVEVKLNLPTAKTTKGLFITVEGGDCVGKSTLIEKLGAYFSYLEKKVELPGSNDWIKI